MEKTIEKICKECGQPFIPTKPRQKYCERKHFRPCPGCGKQIEIKWLSNPTPKCDECRKHRTRKKIQVVTDEIISETSDQKHELHCHSDNYVTRKYVGKSTCGFVHNHKYTVGLVPNEPYGYLVHAISDQTTDDDVNIGLLIAGISSWDRFFKE